MLTPTSSLDRLAESILRSSQPHRAVQRYLRGQPEREQFLLYLALSRAALRTSSPDQVLLYARQAAALRDHATNEESQELSEYPLEEQAGETLAGSEVNFDSKQSCTLERLKTVRSIRASDQNHTLQSPDRPQHQWGTGGLSRRSWGHDPAPVCTLHAFAGTGATLISRCIAAQHNTLVLSEVDPLSPFVPGGFLPTDLIGLSRFASRPAGREIQIQLFLAGLRVLADQCARTGQCLILRDHSHGHFCFSDSLPDRPTLRTMVKRAFAVTSLLFVRHPLDSFLSLQDTGWVQHFSPPTLDEYAQRYHAFLDAYPDCERIKYENFVADPQAMMRVICNYLGLAYNQNYIDRFPSIELSGDSGRRGDVISPRPRRPHPPSLEQEASDSASFMRLLSRLGYGDHVTQTRST